jgi:hypothetical protein
LEFQSRLVRLECRRSGTSGVILFTFAGFEEMQIGSCECGAPKVLLCFMHCWHAVERRQAKAYCFVVVASAEEYSSMRVHIDGKPPDGNAIAFVVIILLSVIALEVLFSRLDTFL